MADRTSRFRRASSFIDDGLIRPGRRTIFLGPYPRLRFQNFSDTIRFRIRNGDTLDHLATEFYRDPGLWWIIADFQPEKSLPIMAPLEQITPGTLLFIPSIAVVRMFFSLE